MDGGFVIVGYVFYMDVIVWVYVYLVYYFGEEVFLIVLFIGEYYFVYIVGFFKYKYYVCFFGRLILGIY